MCIQDKEDLVRMAKESTQESSRKPRKKQKLIPFLVTNVSEDADFVNLPLTLSLPCLKLSNDTNSSETRLGNLKYYKGLKHCSNRNSLITTQSLKITCILNKV